MDRLAHALNWRPQITQQQEVHEAVMKWKRALAHKKYVRERSHTDPEFKMMLVLRSRMGAALRARGARKSSKGITLLGCTVAFFRKHLESLWQPGMGWENYGEWHIDHKRPCASFDLLDPAQQRACFHWSNLQPLWSEDNFRKSKRWEPGIPDGALMVIPATMLG